MSDATLRRAKQLRAAATGRADVLIVGGGVNGVGALLDAAARGLNAVLVERDDLGVGTSSRSSKLVHGGLRYLEQLQFGLVREALTERAVLARLAPHLVRLERFLVPLAGPRLEVPYVGAGLALYDALGGRRGGRCRWIGRDQLKTLAPALRRDGVHGAFEYTDGVTDDARLLTAIARTAADLGGGVLPRVEVAGLLTDGERVVGAAVRDRLTGEHLELRASAVIDATGAFGAAEQWTGTDTTVRPSRGSHLVIPRARIPLERGLTLRVPGRVVFLIPWADAWLLGTTDVAHVGNVDRPTATDGEITYLLDAVNDSLDVGLKRADVLATFAGVRPLVGDGDETSRISRRHQVRELRPGLTTVRGGKWTTYRRTAADAVDLATADMGAVPASPTAQIPLHGAAPAAALARLRSQLVTDGVPDAVAASLVQRHGIEAPQVLARCRATGATERLVEGLPYLVGEVAEAATSEWAGTIEDVLVRRTRAALQDPDQARSAARVVADVLATSLEWKPAERARQLDTYEEASWEYTPNQSNGTLPTARSA